jgi:eukaryotic translation initiation factor 2C
MSYGGRYADYDDEPSRRQAPRDEVSFPEQGADRADPQRPYRSRYEDVPSTPTQRSRADDASRPTTRDVPIPFRGGPPPPPPQLQSPPQSTSARVPSPPTEAFSALSVNPSVAGGVQRSEVSHLRGIEAVERRLTQLKPSPFAVRPGHGVAGKALTVKTNYFQVRPWNGETPKIIQYVSCREYKKPWEAADFSHYDVEIDPHVRVVNQKKPKALLRAVWEQLVLDQKNDPWVGPFSASAFDGRKNA